MKLEVITEHPHRLSHSIPLLFIHGAWHGAWCWEEFLSYFAEYGYESHALSLRGHGNSEGREGIRWYSVARDYVEDVYQTANCMTSHPVLIGHSMGGYVLQKYLEKRAAPAGVLIASLPVSGIFPMLMRFLRRDPASALRAFFLMNPFYLVNRPQLAKERFFSDNFPNDEFRRHFVRLQNESFRGLWETTLFRLPRPHKVKTPLFVIGAENDRVFSISEEQSTARAYNTDLILFPNMAHDMMLDLGWQKVANTILQWLDSRNI